MLPSLLLALGAASLSTAHFTLDWPATAGFSDDDEPKAPCGGVTVVVNDTAPEINVDRFAVAIFSSHPAGKWTFRATKSTKEPFEFTEIVPNITSTGLGDFCLTDLRAPSEWAGSSGVLQVVDNSVDGQLYQCAPVRFVSGSNNTVGPSCKNNTGFSATWSSAEPSGSSNTPKTTPSASAASAAASSTSTAAAAMATGMGSLLGLGLLAAGLAL